MRILLLLTALLALTGCIPTQKTCGVLSTEAYAEVLDKTGDNQQAARSEARVFVSCIEARYGGQ